MKKNIVKAAAKIYAANVVRHSLGTGAMFFTHTSLEDVKYFEKVISEIADNISLERSSTLEDCIKIALEKSQPKK